MMGKIHELLAVEKDVKDVFAKILDETAKTFNQRSAHFLETRKSYRPYNDQDKDLPDEEHTPMVTTVQDKLTYAQGHIKRFVDVELQKERANQIAKSDILVEMPDWTTKTILKEAPVTFLVQMESALDRVRKVYDEIPTLDPAKTWSKDETKTGIWKAEPVKRVRTRKIPKVLVKYDATKEHPAQAEIVQMDESVGEWTHSFSSGALSPKQKSQILDRIDRLIAGVKIARAKANAQEVESAKIGLQFFNFINEGLAVS
jgi:hypothetical protein